MKNKLYIASIIIYLLDQITKSAIMNNFNYLESQTVIPSFFYLTYVKNTGGAFSVLSNYMPLLVIISIAVLIFSVIYINKNEIKDKLSVISYGFVLGGLLGNLTDRIIHKGVIDFLDFKIFSKSFPIFNIADIAIVIGVFILIFIEIRGEINESRERKCTSR